MKLLNFEMQGDFMKIISFNNGMIFSPYYFIEYEFYYIYFLYSARSPYKSLLTFAFKKLMAKGHLGGSVG